MRINEFIVTIIFAAVLAVTSVMDIRTQKIPKWIYPTTCFVCVGVNVAFLGFDKAYLLAAGIGIAAMFCIMLLATIFCGGGGADILLMAALGGAVTVRYAAEVLIFAYIPFMIYGAVKIAKEKKRGVPKEKRTKAIPFVPFVGIGFAADVLYNVARNLMS